MGARPAKRYAASKDVAGPRSIDELLEKTLAAMRGLQSCSTCRTCRQIGEWTEADILTWMDARKTKLSKPDEK